MGEFTNFEQALAKLRSEYQKSGAELAKLQKKWLAMPSKSLEHEVVEIQGTIKGLQKAISILEESRANNPLPLNNAPESIL